MEKNNKQEKQEFLKQLHEVAQSIKELNVDSIIEDKKKEDTIEVKKLSKNNK